MFCLHPNDFHKLRSKHTLYALIYKSMGSNIFQNNQLGDSSLHKMRLHTVQRKIFEKSLSGIAVHLLADKL